MLVTGFCPGAAFNGLRFLTTSCLNTPVHIRPMHYCIMDYTCPTGCLVTFSFQSRDAVSINVAAYYRSFLKKVCLVESRNFDPLGYQSPGVSCSLQRTNLSNFSSGRKNSSYLLSGWHTYPAPTLCWRRLIVRLHVTLSLSEHRNGFGYPFIVGACSFRLYPS